MGLLFNLTTKNANNETQIEMVEKHLNKYGHITSLEAINKYGITRLSAVMYLLKKDGIAFKTRRKNVKNRFNKTCNVTEYYINKEEVWKL